MSIDLGNAPVGTPPTDEQKTQIRKSIAAFAPTAIGPVASFLDPDYFGIFEDGNLAIPKNIADITSLTVTDTEEAASGRLLLTPLTSLQTVVIDSPASPEELQIEVANHQSLETFTLNHISVYSLDFSNCTSLTSINTLYAWNAYYNFTGCTSLLTATVGGGLGDLDLTPCTSLTSFSINSSNFTSLDFTGLENLTSIQLNLSYVNFLYITNCSSLNSLVSSDQQNITSLDISGCPLLLTLNLTGMYTTESVNSILIQLDENGLEDGYVDVTSYEGPTGDGITAAANLVAKGWTVITA